MFIVYCFHAWPGNPTNNFKFKNCLSRETIVGKHSKKENCMYSAFGITFDIAGSWSFDYDTAWNCVIFCADTNSSSHIGNC